jgi:O-antigen ligase
VSLTALSEPSGRGSVGFVTRQRSSRDMLQAFFGSARLAAALSVASICTGVFAFAAHNMIGWAGLNAAIAVLVALCGASAYARREALDWPGLIPISLLGFLAWATLSLFWSEYQWATLGGLAYLAAFTLLGLYVALLRDTIQIIRDVGDVLRLVLAISLALEVFAGLLIDSPIPFLAIHGSLEKGGPISGVIGNRNDLGLIAVIAAISFVMEWRTRSVEKQKAVASGALALITLLFTGSPIAWGTAAVAAAATLVLTGIRRTSPERRTPLLLGALALAALLTVAAWLGRSPIIRALNAGGELEFRLELWRRMWNLLTLRQLEGWGWMGQWQVDVPPYPLFDQGGERDATSALNAYLDVWFQLGTVGLVLFLALLGLAFVRSWLLAARKRSIIHAWPAIVLASLLVSSLAESSILIEFGWLLFVVCCAKASQELSWRNAFRTPLVQDPL